MIEIFFWTFHRSRRMYQSEVIITKHWAAFSTERGHGWPSRWRSRASCFVLFRQSYYCHALCASLGYNRSHVASVASRRIGRVASRRFASRARGSGLRSYHSFRMYSDAYITDFESDDTDVVWSYSYDNADESDDESDDSVSTVVRPLGYSRERVYEFGEFEDNFGWVQCPSKSYRDRQYFHNMHSNCNTWYRPVSSNINIPSISLEKVSQKIIFRMAFTKYWLSWSTINSIGRVASMEYKAQSLLLKHVRKKSLLSL